MKHRNYVFIILFASSLVLLSSCGQKKHTGSSGSFEILPAKSEPEQKLSEEERFLLENRDEYLIWNEGQIIDLREIDPAEYYSSDEVMHRYRELFPFNPEDLLFETPDSSCFSRIGYDYSREALALEFRTTGKIYICYEFTAEDWDEFRNAESLGKYYNRNIKDDFYVEKWDESN